ncbi:hypothetical protein ACH5RR_019156 [Cinchona calisaya]|uniref:ABC transporter domain-containing protein n=1 Tax=Cinchona calisaya TaxID=153742 RepID=A0ABD2ZNK4_9GENT
MVQLSSATPSRACSSPAPLLGCFGDSRDKCNVEETEAHQVVKMRDPNVKNQAAYPLMLSFSNLAYSVKISHTLNRSSIFPSSNKSTLSAKEPETKVLLNDISGEAHDGEILAVLGPSGSGKSTLIDALANRVSKGSLKGMITLNGEQLDSKLLKVISAYVMQDDLLFPMLTVEETLMFAAELRLPGSVTKLEKKQRVHDLMEQLDLWKAAKTRIGDEGHRGVSGGERRRVSIGIEIIHNPIILFLDEPTSGLDSTCAFMVVKVLQRVAQTGSIVIMSIHQPSFRILGLLDHLLYLSHGQIVYIGSPSHLPLYMENIGYPIPEDENPSEAILDLICDLELSAGGINSMVQFNRAWQSEKIRAIPKLEPSPEYGSMSFMEAIKYSVSRGKLVSGKASDSDASPTIEVPKFANPIWTEISVLSKRAFLNSCRMPGIFASRFGATLITGLILASVFLHLDTSATGSEERVRYLAFITSSVFFICCDGTAIILNERNIMLRETSYNAYRRISYCLSDALTWMPSIVFLSIVYSAITFWGPGLNGGFVGFSIYLAIMLALFWTGNSYVIFLSGLLPDARHGYAVVVASLSYFLLFCGVFLSRNQIPVYWIWFHYLSPKKYPYAALMQNEYQNTRKCFGRAIEVFDKTPLDAVPVELKEIVLSGIGDILGINITGSTCMTTGPDVLKRRGVTDLNLWECVVITIAWGFLFRISFYFTLLLGSKNKRK